MSHPILAVEHLTKRFDVSEPWLVRTLTGHRARVNGLALLGRFHTLVSVSDDFTVRLWTDRGDGPICTYTAETPITACAVLSSVNVSGAWKVKPSFGCRKRRPRTKPSLGSSP